MNNFSTISSKCNKSLMALLTRRRLIFSGLNNSSNSNKDLLVSAQKLLSDCKNYGTSCFAGIARCGFIGIELLNSFVKENYISENERKEIMTPKNSFL